VSADFPSFGGANQCKPDPMLFHILMDSLAIESWTQVIWGEKNALL
jgi:hypothetical protein